MGCKDLVCKVKVEKIKKGEFCFGFWVEYIKFSGESFVSWVYKYWYEVVFLLFIINLLIMMLNLRGCVLGV